MRKTLRQEGLVDQERLERLEIGVVLGENSEDLYSEFVRIGGQLGVGSERIYENRTDGCDFVLFLGDSQPRPEFLAEGTPFCRAQLLEDGIRVTRELDAMGGEPSPLQRPGLRTIACSVAWQEAIRMTGTMLPIEVPKRFLDVCLRVDTSTFSNPSKLSELIEVRDAESVKVPFQVIPREDGRGHSLLKMRLEEGSALADQVFSYFQICWKEDESPEPCNAELRIPRSEGGVSGSATFSGLGGLGSWALDTVIEGLRETGSSGSGLSLNMMDPDPEIEEHNLNRQVLYTKEDIGSQKAIVAERKVSRDLPDSTVASFVSSVGIPHLIGLENTGYSLDPSIEEDDDDIFSDHDDIYSVTSGLIAESDVLVCGVDNLRDRSIMNAISSKLGITMVNAGAQGFNGQFDLFTPDGSCMLCRYGMHALREGVRMSCQEDGDVPFSSIVTSTAIFGALEGLALLSILSEGPDSPPDWPTSISWNGRANSFRVSERGSDIFTDAFSHEGPHHAHLYNRLMGLGGPGHQ